MKTTKSKFASRFRRRPLLGFVWLSLVYALSLVSEACGSTADALRDYKEGKYDEALKEYQKLLERNTNDPRLHFNAGAAAYRQKSFTQAAKEFDAALAAPDLKLLGSSYYNRGNALFRSGEQNPDPTKKTEAWKSALKDFESSAKLNPLDADAKSNYEFVKRKLEELKQQQQQQSKSDQNQNQNQDQQQQQQDQQNQNSQKDQNQQQQKSQEAQSEQKQDSSQQNQQAQQQKQEEQQQAQTKEQEQKQKEQQRAQQEKEQQTTQSAGQPKDKPEEGNENGTAAVPGQMTPEQARQLLDAQKGDEQLLQLKPDKKPPERNRPFKDW